MKFELTSTSNRYPTCWRNDENTNNKEPCKCNILEVNTIEELLEYVKKEKYPVIISDDVFAKDHQKDVEWSLETYDGYRE